MKCACGTDTTLTGREAFDKGWMANRNGPLCPRCADKIMKKSRAKAVALYGAAAVDRADRIISHRNQPNTFRRENRAL